MSRGNWYKTKDIIEALERAHGGVFLAAEALGCSRKTIERRAKRNPKVQEVIDKYRGRRSDIAEMRLETAIQAGEPWAIQFQLRTQGKQRGYTERHDFGGWLANLDLSSLTDEQLERIANGEDPIAVLAAAGER